MSNFVNLLDVVYPIGSIYMTMDMSANPAETIGGTWTQVESVFLRATSDTSHVGNTGGYAASYVNAYFDYYYGLLAHEDYDHILTFGGGASAKYTEQKQSNPYQLSSNVQGSRATASPSQLFIQATFDNLPPYLNCLVWYRTA